MFSTSREPEPVLNGPRGLSPHQSEYYRARSVGFQDAPQSHRERVAKRGASYCKASAAAFVLCFGLLERQGSGWDTMPAHTLPAPTCCTCGRQPLIPLRSSPRRGFQGRGLRARKAQRGISYFRRISSKTSLAGRVRPCVTSSSPWRIPSSASARAAISSRR